MKRKQPLVNLTTALVLLMALSGAVGSFALSKGIVPEEAGIETATDLPPNDRTSCYDVLACKPAVVHATGPVAQVGDSLEYSVV